MTNLRITSGTTRSFDLVSPPIDLRTTSGTTRSFDMVSPAVDGGRRTTGNQFVEAAERSECVIVREAA